MLFCSKEGLFRDFSRFGVATLVKPHLLLVPQVVSIWIYVCVAVQSVRHGASSCRGKQARSLQMAIIPFSYN